MGNESSAAAPAPAPAHAPSLTANTANMTTKNPITYTLSAVPETPVTTMTTTPITTTAAAATTATTTTTTTTTATPITTTAAATTTTTATTTTNAAPAITSTATDPKDIPNTTAAPTESTSTPTFYSIVKAATAETTKAKSASSAYSNWYKWSKFEKQKREKGKTPWYMSPTPTNTFVSNPETPILTPSLTPTLSKTFSKIDDDRKEISDPSDIIAVPSYLLRSTAVYSPPHGDRIQPGRNELINTDTSTFKYYFPENRSKITTGMHTKATMYKMNTLSRQIPLPGRPPQLSATNLNVTANPTRNSASLPTFVSRGQQASLEAQPADSSQVRYYERQPSQLITVSGISNARASNVGFYHLSTKDTISQPILPSIEKPPPPAPPLNDPPRSSTIQSFPPNPPPPRMQQPRPSILKHPSTAFAQDISNPLSEQTHNKVLDELRRQNPNTKDGIYRVKKVHLLEKTNPEPRPAPVPYTRPVRRPSSKASQSILRSEKLLFSGLFNRKK